MAIQHTVQTGDTVSAIAKRFGVPTTSVSGFRSNDPNVIFPGEVLTIQESQTSPQPQNQTPIQTPATSQVNQTPLQQTPLTPTPQTQPKAEQTQTIAPAVPVQPSPTVTKEVVAASEPKETAPDVDLTITPEVDQLFENISKTFTTPSGATVSETGELVSGPAQQANQLFGQFGISGDALQKGFQTNPFGTLSELVNQVMQATGLPDVRANITSISREIEGLENERDAEIARIQDDPFSSVGSKAQRIENINDKFDRRINARVNRLTLLQSAHEDARQQAQFAATTAINLFGQQQQFQQKQLESLLDKAEKVQEAKNALGPLSTETVGGFTVLRDATGKVIATQKPDDETPQKVAQKVAAINVTPGKPESFIELLRASSGGKSPAAEERKALAKGFLVVDQIDSLTALTQSEATGPVLGVVRSNNPYDKKAQEIKAQLTQIVPNLARGVFGEVGVLTDADVALYAKTLPNLSNPADIRDAIASLTLKTVQRSLENQLEVLAASGIDVSGFENKYNVLGKTINRIEERLGVAGASGDSEAEAIFDEVVGTRDQKNWLHALWSGLTGS